MRLLCLIVFFAGLCHGVSKATQCVAQGRFPNNDAEDCRGYTMCLIGGVSEFTQYKLTCPFSFVYSHLEHQCTNATNYQCMHNYVCNTTGNFENPLSTNCSSYIACPESIEGIGMARQVMCPAGSLFSPVAGTCISSGYTCGAVPTDIPVTLPHTEVPVTVPQTETRVTTPHTKGPITATNIPATPKTTFNVQMSSENGFQLSSRGSMNSAFDICSTRALFLWFFFMYINN